MKEALLLILILYTRKLPGFIKIVKGETLNSNLDQPYLNQPSEFPKTRYNRSVSEKPLSDSILCYRHCYVFEKPILFSFTYTAKLYFPVSQKYVGAV